MVRKNFKMASWSLVLSIVTLLVLASTILVANTSFGKDLPFFTNTELKSDLEKSYLEIEKLISEKEFILFELKDQLEKYKKLEAENEVLKAELELRHQQIDDLILKIDSLQKDVSKLMTLKVELAKAKKEYEKKLAENTLNTTKNKIISFDETQKNRSAAKKDSLTKETLQKTTDKDSPVKDIIKDKDEDIRLLNSKVQTFHKKNSGIKTQATNVSKVNSLELEYTLYVDKNLTSRSNIFYIQIFDTNNKNVGKTKSTFINENELVYSFISKVEYEDEVTQIKEEFSTEGLNLDTGVYFLNIFSENGKLLSSRSFKLD